ncbi:MAG: Hemolysin C [bacterium ADurb.Bin363]|nr:MAG: Hemolysin C [bacterium ADurb.Bin363]
MDNIIALLIIIVLILLNAIFVASEFAIVGTPRASIERRASHGERIAKIISQIIHSPKLMDQYTTTGQLGITLASLGLGMYGEHKMIEWIGYLLEKGITHEISNYALAKILAVTLLTYLHIVFGEMVPKVMALQQPEGIVLVITPFIICVQVIFYPMVKIFNGMGIGLLRLFGIKRQITENEHYYTPEELELIVKESHEGGLIHAESAQVIKDLFEFGDLTAEEVMVPRVKITGIPLDADHSILKEIVHTSIHTRYPIYDGDLDHITGVVHIKDILRRLVNKNSIQSEDIRKVPYVPETSTVDNVIMVMRKAHAQMVIVMDEHGGTAGLITIEDLYEEVVGEIQEGTTYLPEIYKDSKGLFHVFGTARLDRVGEKMDIMLEHEEVDTVSGLVLTLLGRPPEIGDSVIYKVEFK